MAAIDTGGPDALTLMITSVEPAVGSDAQGRFVALFDLSNRLDSARVVARLARCHAGHCLALATGSSYAATAALGSRSVASYAVPRS